VQAGGVYVTFDGSTPSSSNGHLYAVNTREFWSANRADAAKFIRATVDATVYGSPFTC
jgi:ABC-type nitrate/sulfonate/bicarbonate transport system substrate-binding protein